MRIRQVKPAFWSDKVMAALSKGVRLTYIGLWMQADDTGWLRWSCAQVGAELFPFESAKRRERELEADLEALAAAGRVVVHPCGHVEIPHLSQHQRLAGPTHRVETEYRAHLRGYCPARVSPLLPATPRLVSNGQDRLGTVADEESAGIPKTEFQEAVGPIPGVHQ